MSGVTSNVSKGAGSGLPSPLEVVDVDGAKVLSAAQTAGAGASVGLAGQVSTGGAAGKTVLGVAHGLTDGSLLMGKVLVGGDFDKFSELWLIHAEPTSETLVPFWSIVLPDHAFTAITVKSQAMAVNPDPEDGGVISGVRTMVGGFTWYDLEEPEEDFASKIDGGFAPASDPRLWDTGLDEHWSVDIDPVTRTLTLLHSGASPIKIGWRHWVEVSIVAEPA